MKKVIQLARDSKKIKKNEVFALLIYCLLILFLVLQKMSAVVVSAQLPVKVAKFDIRTVKADVGYQPLRQIFYKALEASTIPAFKTLNGLLNLEKVSKKLFVNIHTSSDPSLNDIILVFINALSDTLLENLASIGFPRGFPILMNDGQLTLHGFYPKFANDKREGSEKQVKNAKSQKLVISEFSSTKAILDIKASGFFLGFTFFKTTNADGECVMRMLTTSKKSTDNAYTQSFEKHILTTLNKRGFSIEKLAERMEGEKLTLWGEWLWSEDKTHGYATTKDLYLPHALGSCIVPAEKQATNFMSWKTKPELQKFCSEYGFDFFPEFRITGAKYIPEFFAKLSQPATRNVMDYRLFIAIWRKFAKQYPENFTEIPGSFDHERDISSVLEGLIVELDDGRRIKFKFNRYLIATLGFRTLLSELQTKFEYKLGSSLTKEQIEYVQNFATKYIESWVIADQTADETFRTVFLTFATQADALYAKYIQSKETISFHIWLRDELFPSVQQIALEYEDDSACVSAAAATTS